MNNYVLLNTFFLWVSIYFQKVSYWHRAQNVNGISQNYDNYFSRFLISLFHISCVMDISQKEVILELNYVLTNWIPDMYRMNTSDQFCDSGECIRWLYRNHFLMVCIGKLHNFILSLWHECKSSSWFLRFSSFLSYFWAWCLLKLRDSMKNKPPYNLNFQCQACEVEVMWSFYAVSYHGKMPTCFRTTNFVRSEHNRH